MIPVNIKGHLRFLNKSLKVRVVTAAALDRHEVLREYDLPEAEVLPSKYEEERNKGVESIFQGMTSVTDH